MLGIKAFVGHSFTESDAEIVRSFLDFFDHIAGLGIGFTWCHAEEAEPKVVTEKVLELIKGKDLFIGVCTAKETVVTNPRATWFSNKSKFIFDKKDSCTKTSDWIIQEIGLAIGQKMTVMLLVEEGLRSPGGLQGNLEYIEFKRAAPEKCFMKVLEMIKAIKPAIPVSSSLVQAEDQGDIEKPRDKQISDSKEDETFDINLDPDQSWDEDKYYMALFNAIWEKDSAREDVIVSSLREKLKESVDSEKEIEMDATRWYWKIRWGGGAALENLKQIFERNPTNKKVGKLLGQGYEAFGSFEVAGEHFRALSDSTNAVSDKVEFLCNSVKNYNSAKNQIMLSETLDELRSLANIDNKCHSSILSTLVELYKEQGKDEFHLATLERYLALNPDDADKRFSVAYKYSELNKNNLSLYHYTRIPYRSRSSTVFNNLGVSYSHLKMPSKSIESYREAEKAGNTLAMSNIAHQLISVGFLKEAEEICASAVNIKDFDKHIGTAITKIRDIKEEEDSKEKKHLDESFPISKFFNELGSGIIKENVILPHSTWLGPLCSLDVEVKGHSFIAQGFYEMPEGKGLLGLVNPYISQKPNEPAKMIQVAVKYVGAINGYAIKGTLETTKSGTTTILGDANSAKDILMLVQDNSQEILVFEQETQNFHTLKLDKRTQMLKESGQ